MLKEIALFFPTLTSLSTSFYNILAFFLKLANITIIDVSSINERYLSILEVNKSRI